MPKEFDPAEVAQQAFAPGWEKEHGVDYSDYLDSLVDPDDPLHEVAVAADLQDRATRKRMKQAVAVLSAARRILVFTGAGVSTESGIPDFRGPDGLWKRVDPADFSLGAFVGNPAARRRSWQMMRNERLIGDSVEPNAAHYAIVALWEAERLVGCVTQNVDGLHQAAGLPDDQVAELHGNAATVTCWECKTVVPFAAVRQRLEDGDPDPACNECGGVLKPSMVMFGEMLPPEPMKRAALWAHDSDAVLVIGSTLSIYPAASVVAKTARRGKPLVIVNQGETDHDDLAAAKLDGPAGTLLPELVRKVLDGR